MKLYRKIIIHPSSRKEFKNNFIKKTKSTWSWERDDNYRDLDLYSHEIRIENIDNILEIANFIRENGGLPILYVGTRGDDYFEIYVIEKKAIDYQNFLYRGGLK